MSRPLLCLWWVVRHLDVDVDGGVRPFFSFFFFVSRLSRQVCPAFLCSSSLFSFVCVCVCVCNWASRPPIWNLCSNKNRHVMDRNVARTKTKTKEERENNDDVIGGRGSRWIGRLSVSHRSGQTAMQMATRRRLPDPDTLIGIHVRIVFLYFCADKTGRINRFDRRPEIDQAGVAGSTAGGRLICIRSDRLQSQYANRVGGVAWVMAPSPPRLSSPPPLDRATVASRRHRSFSIRTNHEVIKVQVRPITIQLAKPMKHNARPGAPHLHTSEMLIGVASFLPGRHCWGSSCSGRARSAVPWWSSSAALVRDAAQQWRSYQTR